MENKNRPGGKARAMEGKGFYIVLFLCAAVIGASAWILLTDVGTNVDEIETASHRVDVSDAVVTMLPAGTQTEPDDDVPAAALEETEPVAETDADAAPADDEAQAVFTETATSYVWPVQGAVEVPYSVETLRYDATMADWRTHDGIDIACMQGDQVIASASGTVVSVVDDDLYGTTVEIDHRNGVHSIYANLASEPPVWEGEDVAMGQVIGSVGGTALVETNEVPHLHFAVTVDGLRADPMDYLPTMLTE